MPSPNRTAARSNTRIKPSRFLLLAAFSLGVGRFAAAAPRLLIVVVVDQMRGDAFDRYRSDFKYGFKELAEKSKFYANCRLNHVPTETAPGHATISTGKAPFFHGIIGNEWFNRETGKEIYCVFDPDNKVGPAQLLIDTLGDALKKKDGESKVVALSYKDRAAIFLGGRKADAVAWYDPKKDRFVTSTAYKTGAGWLDRFSETHPAKIANKTTTETDRAVFSLVQDAFREFNLGQDEHPDLLLVSFSATDFIGHQYGPDSNQMRYHLLALDRIIGDLLRLANDRAGGDVALALTSDHGAMPVPGSPAGKKIGATRLTIKNLANQLEDACQRRYPVPGKKWVLGVYVPDIYLNRALVQSKRLDWGDFLLRIAADWKEIPLVAQVYLNNPLVMRDQWNEMYLRSFCAGRSGDLFIRMKPGVLVTNNPVGTSHGSPYDYDISVPLLFYGRGFAVEKSSAPVTNEILAPTLAQTVDIDFW